MLYNVMIVNLFGQYKALIVVMIRGVHIDATTYYLSSVAGDELGEDENTKGIHRVNTYNKCDVSATTVITMKASSPPLLIKDNE